MNSLVELVKLRSQMMRNSAEISASLAGRNIKGVLFFFGQTNSKQDTHSLHWPINLSCCPLRIFAFGHLTQTSLLPIFFCFATPIPSLQRKHVRSRPKLLAIWEHKQSRQINRVQVQTVPTKSMRREQLRKSAQQAAAFELPPRRTKTKATNSRGQCPLARSKISAKNLHI